MTLGPALCVLAAVDGRIPEFSKPLLTFGRVPLFYYLVHLALIHFFAMLICYWRYGDAHFQLEYDGRRGGRS